MKPKRPAKSKVIQPAAPGYDGLLRGLREFIAESRRQVLRAVDVVQVRTCWGVGRHIVEFEQGGAARAEYGARLLPRLAEKLSEEFGRGFDASNLRYMRLFYIAFPNCDALRHELSWTHYRTLLRVEDAAAREWYVNEAVAQNWSSRALGARTKRHHHDHKPQTRFRRRSPRGRRLVHFRHEIAHHHFLHPPRPHLGVAVGFCRGTDTPEHPLHLFG